MAGIDTRTIMRCGRTFQIQGNVIALPPRQAPRAASQENSSSEKPEPLERAYSTAKLRRLIKSYSEPLAELEAELIRRQALATGLESVPNHSRDVEEFTTAPQASRVLSVHPKFETQE